MPISAVQKYRVPSSQVSVTVSKQMGGFVALQWFEGVPCLQPGSATGPPTVLHAGGNPGGGCLEQPRDTVTYWWVMHQFVKSTENLFASVSPNTFSIAEKQLLSHVKFKIQPELIPQKYGWSPPQ